MKKYILEISLALGLCASLVAGALALETQQAISCKLIRLHIIANSDSAEDQALKLLVRDEVLKKVEALTEGCKTTDEAEKIVSEKLDVLQKCADAVILKNGFAYSSRAEISDVYFPTKVYDSFSLPAGKYKALRIHLGEGLGKNWWCVLFPPACVSAAEAKTELSKNGFTEKELSFVTSDTPQYQFKFKLLEIIEGVAEKF